MPPPARSGTGFNSHTLLRNFSVAKLVYRYSKPDIGHELLIEAFGKSESVHLKTARR
jgi:hypothetical protein